MQKRHLVLPDTQVKPGVKTDHLRWAGLYAAAKKPDRIIHIGDHWDMPSLSSYDKGKKSFEGRRYKNDIASGNAGLDLFMEPIYAEKERCLQEGIEWECTFDFFEGNHEYRIQRAVNDQAELDGLISRDDFNLAQHGWRFNKFLEVRVLDGVAFSHYFTSGVMGRPVSSARAMLTKKHMSCIMGHVQRYEIDTQYTGDGKRLTGIFAGCYYQHDEDYLNPQGNASTWRGIHMLYNVEGGTFTHNNIPIEYLKDRYALPTRSPAHRPRTSG